MTIGAPHKQYTIKLAFTMMASVAVSLLTKRLSHVHLAPLIARPLLSIQAPVVVNVRSFGTKREKKLKKKVARELKIEQEKQKQKDLKVQQTTPQFQLNQSWVDFQKSIAVEGRDTGQTTNVVSSTGVPKRNRGGKKRAQKLARKLAEEKMEEDDVSGGQYPPLRYSEEETNRLLTEAYENLPKRAGKRGTRNLKRQKRRWFLVRQIRSISKKNYGIRTHERRMKKRSERVQSVLKVKREAPYEREKEAAYQQYVMEKWSEFMLRDEDALEDFEETGQSNSR